MYISNSGREKERERETEWGEEVECDYPL